MVGGVLARAVLKRLALNSTLRWWWADPAAGYVVAFYGVREAQQVIAQ